MEILPPTPFDYVLSRTRTQFNARGVEVANVLDPDNAKHVENSLSLFLAPRPFLSFSPCLSLLVAGYFYAME